jgi:hypothetical protein
MKTPTLQAAWTAIIESWERNHNKNPRVAQTEYNLYILKSILNDAITIKTMPSLEEWQRLIKVNSHRLQFEATPTGPYCGTPFVAPVPTAPVDPKTAIPHQDVFPGVDTVEKCVQYIKTVKIPYTNQPKINELLAYLKEHNIRGKGNAPIPTDARIIGDPNPNDNGDAIRGRTKSGKADHSRSMSDLGDTSPIRTVVKYGNANATLHVNSNDPVTTEDLSTPLGQAVALLGSLTAEDVGTVTVGRNGRLQNFKNRTVLEIQNMRVRGVPEEKILEHVEAGVEKLRSRSISK